MNITRLNSLRLNFSPLNKEGEGGFSEGNPIVDENGYIIFQDPEVARICAENWGDGLGITLEQAAAVTSLGRSFISNESIQYFEELELFTNVTRIGIMGTATSIADSFKDSPNLKSVHIPTTVTGIGYYAFSGCASLETIGNMTNVTEIRDGAFNKCSSFSADIIMPNLTKMVGGFVETKIKRVLDLGSITSLPQAFTRCHSLEVAILPQSLTTIAHYAFSAIQNDGFVIVSKSEIPPSLGSISNSLISQIYVPDDGTGTVVQAYKTATNWSAYASRIFPISQLATDNPELFAEIEEYL